MHLSLSTLAALIEFGGALVIAFYVGLAGRALLRGGAPLAARALVSEGLVAGLSLKTAATLLKTIELASWDQIGMLVAVLALRLFVKRTLPHRAG
jgi:hypothetical protein